MSRTWVQALQDFIFSGSQGVGVLGLLGRGVKGLREAERPGKVGGTPWPYYLLGKGCCRQCCPVPAGGWARPHNLKTKHKATQILLEQEKNLSVILSLVAEPALPRHTLVCAHTHSHSKDLKSFLIPS